MIPRRLAYRIWAACLAGRAAHLRWLASDAVARQADRRAGPAGLAANRSKAAGRLKAAEQLDREARLVEGWVGDERRCKGADIDPAVVAWVCALMHGDARAAGELRRLGIPAGATSLRDVRGIIESILTPPS